jgi:hypothetical protein
MKLLRRTLLLLGLAMIMQGCTGTLSAIEEEAVVSSIRYDALSCGELTLRRNALADSFGLDRQTRRETLEERSPLVGLVTPDLSSERVRQERRAVSLLHAMNGSLERRDCGAAGD